MTNVYSKSNIDCMLEGCETLEEFKEKLASDECCVDVDGLDVQEGEVIVVSYPVDFQDNVVELVHLLQAVYDKNPVIGLVNNIDVLLEYPDDAAKMLEGMLNKVSAAKKSKIIIP